MSDENSTVEKKDAGDENHGTVDGLVQLFESCRKGPGYPRNLRRLLLGTIRTYVTLFATLQYTMDIPVHLKLSFALSMMRDLMQLVFAMVGQQHEGEGTEIQRFVDHILSRGYLTREDGLLFGDLKVQAEKARLSFLTTGKDSFTVLETDKIFNRMTGFSHRFERWIKAELTTAVEKKYLRWARWAAVGLGALIVLFVIIWYFVTGPTSSISDSSLITSPGGISATYYQGTNFNQKLLERSDKTISINTRESPAQGVPSDNFSVRWKGYLRFPESGIRYVCTQSDDGARLYVDNIKIIDDWKLHATMKNCAEVKVEKGWHPITVEYFDGTVLAFMQLLEGPTKDSVKQVPADRLCCFK
jgi:hypothetical protein